MKKKFLPVCMEDAKALGYEEIDFVMVSGDAYVDHPSFGVAIICRVLESQGYRVGIIPQPDWKRKESIMEFGEPKLGFLVAGGNIDSMVNHYSVAKKRRDTDAYSPNGEIGHRPDRATIVYGNLIRQVYKKTPIILGGIEASLRRLAHYDYWDNKVRRSILLDSGADLLIYGMGENPIIEIADALKANIPIEEIQFVQGTTYKTKELNEGYKYHHLHTFSEVQTDKKAFAESFMEQTKLTNFSKNIRLVEQYKENEFVVQNPPQAPISKERFDEVYDLPYTREVHPMYKGQRIPAIEEVKFSIISNRGCFGNCNFCALTFHQGRIIQTRSHESIIKEAKKITEYDDFKGYIHDVGGPTANFRIPSCKKQLKHGTCPEKDCLGTDPCHNLDVDHEDYLRLLRRLKDLPKVKKVFIRSGIRFDYVMYDKNDQFFKELVKDHTSGQLKVAPEHVSNRVLGYMGKPFHNVYKKFSDRFYSINKQYHLKQFLVPYLMSSHPGSGIEDAIELAEFLRDERINPQQVQDFYPTPSTISTMMYYTELDPRTMKPVFVAKSPHEKAMQRALIQYRNPKNYRLVREALLLAKREDLIGFHKEALLRPRPNEKIKSTQGYGKTPTKQNDKSYKNGASGSISQKSKSQKNSKKKKIRNVHKKKK